LRLCYEPSKRILAPSPDRMSQELSIVPFPLSSPPELKRLAPRLRRAWESFVVDGATPTPELVRPSIASRWRVAAGSGLDPLLSRVPMLASEEELEPLFFGDDFAAAGRRVLEDMAGVVAENDHALFLTDARGCVLHVTGEPSVVDALRDLNARTGGRWDEDAAGPNGMGTALLADTPTIVFGAEHFCERFHPWVCYGAPVHDPIHGHVLGVVNLTGWAYKTKSNQLPLAIGLARSVEYLLVGRRGSWRQALFDVARELSARYPFDGLVVTDAAGNALVVNDKARELLRRRRGRVESLLRHPAVAPFVNGQPGEAEATLALGDGRIHISMRAVARAGHSIGAAFVLREPAPARGERVPAAGRSEHGFGDLLGEHPAFLETLRFAARAARSTETVLLTGETGTGKERIAAAIHRVSARSGRPFVAVDCASLPRELAESELFGYDSGAFTGARGSGKRGRFELAEGGTLFLDEVGELALDVQAKLLRVLEERHVFRIGGERSRAVDVRVVAATNRDLSKAVADGAFRLDLYHRLAVLEIHVPSLRERGRDVVALARRFLADSAARAGRALPRLSIEVEETFLRYPWPGNVRELKNVVAHVVHWADGDEIGLAELPRRLLEPAAVRAAATRGSLRAIEDEIFRATVDSCGGNTSAAARRLGINRSTIYRRIKRPSGGPR
jgi:transcriptional regulator of acetoin/glycerol metabolism